MDDFLDITESAEDLLEVMHSIDNTVANAVLPKEIADIVKNHAKVGAGAGLASGWVPGAGAVALTAVAVGSIWSMYLRINNKIGLSFSENLLKTLASGIATNLAGYFATMIAINAVASFIPIAGTAVAAALAAGIVYAMTLVSGVIYLKIITGIFRAKKDPNKMSAEDLKDMADDIIENEDMEEILKQAKNSYKK